MNSDAPPPMIGQMLAAFGMTLKPEDRAAFQRAFEEIMAARTCLRPLSIDDEPAPVFQP